MDDHKILRVGDRLEKENIWYNAKYPIILPKKSPFSKLIIRHLIFRAIKFEIYKWNQCTCALSELQYQLMGELPSQRVNVSWPFIKVGVDYTGSILTFLPRFNYRNFSISFSKINMQTWVLQWEMLQPKLFSFGVF